MVKAYYDKHPERFLALNRKYIASDKGKQARARAQRRYRAKHKDRQRAHDAVAYAVKTGALEPLGCFVCGAKAHAHHEDYSKPLDVVWLCDKHHKARHKQMAIEGIAP
jgi:hypothetical protein